MTTIATLAKLEAAIETYQEAKRDVTRLSLLAAAQLSRATSPSAHRLVVTESDQEGCGLTGVELLDAERDLIRRSEDERFTWDDTTSGALSNLTPDVEDVWGEFFHTDSIAGDFLLIDAILEAAQTWDATTGQEAM